MNLTEIHANNSIQPYEGFENEYRYTQRLIEQQLAQGTKRVYRSDWELFKTWCHARSLIAETATPDAVALFLGCQFEEGIHPSTLNRRVAAIKFAFTCRQLFSPTDHPRVRGVLKGIRRDPNAPSIQQKKAVTPDILKQFLEVIPDDTLQGIRDKAALLLGFAGAFRRSELLAIDIEDITFIPDEGMDIRVKRSKTDQEGKGHIKSIAQGKTHCPILAVKRWIEVADITTGPLFRGIVNGKNIKDNRLSVGALYDTMRAYAKKAGFTANEYSPHSLRAGFITAAAENEKDLFKIMDVSLHVDPRSIKAYVRYANRYKNHAGKGLL